ncbi:MAG: PaaI family thioesterase [Ruminococcaceae bacterium]|nr:PaaI family thioesterase [Oscillospiraceae bacterium]
MTELERVRNFFEGDVFATSATGIVIEEIGDKFAKCTLKLDSRHKNAANQVMGGVIFTLADFAFAVSTNRGQGITVTISSNISFIGTVKGDTLIATSKLLKDGKRSCFYEISVTDDLGNLVAVVSTVGTHVG